MRQVCFVIKETFLADKRRMTIAAPDSPPKLLKVCKAWGISHNNGLPEPMSICQHQLSLANVCCCTRCAMPTCSRYLLRPILTQLMLCNPDGSFCMLQYHELMRENCNKQKALDDALQKLHVEIDKRTKMQNEQELRRVDNCRIQQELDMLQTRLAQEQVTLFLSCSCQYTTQGSQQCNFGRLRCISCCCGICDASYCGDS